MRERLSLAVLLLFALASVGRAAEANQNEDDDIKLQAPQNSCSFYCFILGKEDKTIVQHVNASMRLNCTHVVYGYALVDRRARVSDPNKNDYPMSATWGNYRYLLELTKQQPPITTLLAIREAPGVHFIEDRFARARAIGNMVDKAYYHYFDGLYINLRGASYLSFHYENFVRDLRMEINGRAALKGTPPLKLVIAVDGQDAFEAHHKLVDYAPMVDAFYLKSDEMISAEDENTAVLVEPLYPDTNVLSIDVISETAERLVKYGVPPERLVIGLSAWGRGYELIDGNQTNHGAPVYGVLQLPETIRNDGRFAYQEICDLVDHSGLIYHEKAAAASFVVNDTQFFSYNPPTHEVVRRKVQWISSHGFGGIGVTQMEADDPNDRCENGAYPLHSLISRSFKCSKRHYDADRTTSCNRACIYRPNRAPIAFEDLTPEWCSHLILSSAGITSLGAVAESEEYKQAVKEYVKWAVTKKPWLILSIGADVPIDDWQMVLANSTARRVFVQSARQFLVDNNARGIELSLVSDESPADVQQMRSNFDTLLEDLRKELPRKTLLFVTVTSSWTFAEVYNSTTLNRTADFIILEGHRFHRSNAVFTGHHSPLFSDPLLLDNTNKSIDGMSRVWLKSAVPKERMLIGFSAVGMSMSLSASSQAQNRADDERFLRIDTDSTQVRSDRKGGPGTVSQTELCDELVGSSTNHRFITELGVPVAVKGDEFFAYDDVRSVQTKTIWTSMNGFGGVAFHAIEMDNADGKCPRGKKFSLLKKIASTQACKDCLAKPSPQGGQHPCDPAPFSMVCSYRLPDQNEPQPLMPTDIPYANCTEVVVEDALWSADGHLRFRDTNARQHLAVLKNHREQNEAAAKTRVIAAIKCTMLPEKLEEMLKSDRNITASILEHVARYSFDGVEMRCDHVLTEKTRADYMKFTQLLQAHLHSYHHYSACPSTLSIRIPVWNTNLDAKYDVNLLNSLDHVVLEPFEVSQHARLISPLFGLDKSEESHAIDSTIAAWIEAGVYSKKIVMHIPAYGIQQNFTTALETIGASVSNYTMVTQRDICTITQTAGVNEHTLYDLVAAFATTPQRQWITYETAPIVAYKVDYAIREKLGGVGLVTVNKDDFGNVCGAGAFPLLSTVQQAFCT